jgi:hypothetical protein
MPLASLYALCLMPLPSLRIDALQRKHRRHTLLSLPYALRLMPVVSIRIDALQRTHRRRVCRGLQLKLILPH